MTGGTDVPHTGPAGFRLRHAEPTDHATVAAVLDGWWGGREMTAMLPRLFFVHFRPTSFVVEAEGRLVGFLCGFLSQTYADEAYVHFVGVDPAFRGQGVGRLLYDRFVAAVVAQGRTVVRAVTSPVNEDSVAFHRSLGFVAEPAARGYDGPGEDRVRLTLRIGGAPPG